MFATVRGLFTIKNRVCGYIRMSSAFNRGKLEEFRQRKKFNVSGALNVIDTVSVDYQLANKVTPESLAQQSVAM